jgi:hypothetical protein
VCNEKNVKHKNRELCAFSALSNFKTIKECKPEKRSILFCKVFNVMIFTYSHFRRKTAAFIENQGQCHLFLNKKAVICVKKRKIFFNILKIDERVGVFLKKQP